MKTAVGYSTLIFELGVSPVRYETIKLLKSKPMNAKELTNKLSEKKIISKTSYANVHRHLDYLAKVGFVTFKTEAHMKGKPKTAYLTDKGKSAIG